METTTTTVCPVLVPPDQYWISREPVDREEYWEEREDPDGRIRDALQEIRWGEHQQLTERREFERLPAGSRVLDFGCGNGGFFFRLRGEFEKVGVDTSSRARSLARCHCKVYESLGDVIRRYSLPSMDAIRCHHVIEHLRDPMETLKKLRSLLVSGGLLVISTPDFGSPCATRFGDRYRMLHDETHCSLFSNESMHRFLRDHGFEIYRVDYPAPDILPAHIRLWNGSGFRGWSPPWPGNWITFFCRKVFA